MINTIDDTKYVRSLGVVDRFTITTVFSVETLGQIPRTYFDVCQLIIHPKIYKNVQVIEDIHDLHLSFFLHISMNIQR